MIGNAALLFRVSRGMHVNIVIGTRPRDRPKLWQPQRSRLYLSRTQLRFNPSKLPNSANGCASALPQLAIMTDQIVMETYDWPSSRSG